MFLSPSIVNHLRDVATWPDLDGGRYSSIRPIGVGGMGRVFAARDEPLGRDVAVKISHAPLAGSGLDARLRQEAQVLAQLEHPGIVPVHSLGQLGDGRLFYVMKLVRGQTLGEAPGPPNESERLAIFERVVDAVAFAHSRGVVHRDLKPSNIMLGPFGEVLVMDWGVAKLLESDEADAAAHGESVASSGATQAGTRVGTPGFMSPEQASGDVSAVGPSSDVYALGALLFWQLTGAPPSGDAGAAAAALRERRPRISRRLRAVVMKCLSRAPAGRYADAAGVAADLARYRAGEALVALPETAVDKVLRFGTRHLTLIVLVTAYVLMRAAVAWWR